MSQKEPLTDENEQAPETKETQTNEIEPKRTHYTPTEKERIRELFEAEYSAREIATKMNRTVPGIKNLKRRLKLTQKIQNEIPALQKMRNTLEEEIIDQRITLSLLDSRYRAHENKLKEITEQVKTQEEKLASLKPTVDYYYTHQAQIHQELRNLMEKYRDIIGIQKIGQLLGITLN